MSSRPRYWLPASCFYYYQYPETSSPVTQSIGFQPNPQLSNRDTMTNQRCQIFILKSIIFSSSCLTLFFLPFPIFKKWELLGSYMGGTWEERFRFTFVSFCFPIVSKRNLASSFSLHSLIFRTVLVSPSLRLCFPIDSKAKFYRCQSEVKAKVKRS